MELNAKALQTLDEIVLILKKNSTLNLVINTHTDSRGNEKFNTWLGDRRANIILQHLNIEDIEFDRISVKSYGEERLVNNCGDKNPCTDLQHAQNRRAEFEFVRR